MIIKNFILAVMFVAIQTPANALNNANLESDEQGSLFLELPNEVLEIILLKTIRPNLNDFTYSACIDALKNYFNLIKTSSKIKKILEGYSKTLLNYKTIKHLKKCKDVECSQCKISIWKTWTKNSIGTLVRWACKNGEKAIVKAFLSEISPNDQNDCDGRTLLHYASMRGHAQIVDLLINWYIEVDPDIKCGDGLTPLHYACDLGYLDVVKKLLYHPELIDPNLGDENSWTALHYACQNGLESIVKELLKHPYIDSNSKDINGDTPYTFAIEYNHLDIAKILLEHNKTHESIKAQDNNNNENTTLDDFKNAIVDIKRSRNELEQIEDQDLQPQLKKRKNC